MKRLLVTNYIVSSERMLICCLTVLMAGCTDFFFQPSDVYYGGPEYFKVKPQTIVTSLVDSTGKHSLDLKAWHLSATTPESKGTVIFLHGNAENISSHIANVYWLPAKGYDVHLLEYRGYGFAKGHPSFKTVFTDIRVQIDNWDKAVGGNHQRVFLFGESLGGAIATKVAFDFQFDESNFPFCGIIIEAAFSNYQKIAREIMAGMWFTYLFQYPASYLFLSENNPESLIDALRGVPILVIHSEEDTVVPFHHGQMLYNLAPGNAGQDKQFWQISGEHITLFKEEKAREKLTEYLDSQRCGLG